MTDIIFGGALVVITVLIVAALWRGICRISEPDDHLTDIKELAKAVHRELK